MAARIEIGAAMPPLKDLKGHRFGSLVAVERVGTDKNGHAKWKCVCEKCGKTKVYNYVQLVNGKTKDCGCGISQGKDLTGKEIGALTVVKPVGLDKSRYRLWQVRCVYCRKKTVMSSRRLTRNDLNPPKCPYCGA